MEHEFWKIYNFLAYLRVKLSRMKMLSLLSLSSCPSWQLEFKVHIDDFSRDLHLIFKKLENSKFKLEVIVTNFILETWIHWQLIYRTGENWGEKLIKRVEALILLDVINVENVHEFNGEGFPSLKILCQVRLDGGTHDSWLYMERNLGQLSFPNCIQLEEIDYTGLYI